MQKRNIIIFTVTLVILLGGIVILISRSASTELTVRLNEESAIDNLKQLRRVQSKFFQENGRYAALQELCLAKLVEDYLCDGIEGGYKFNIEATGNNYAVNATPISYGKDGTGTLSFFLDESGVIRGDFKEGGLADKNAIPLPER